jgi:hypothetical protein
MEPQNQDNGIADLTDKELINMVNIANHNGHIYSPSYTALTNELFKRFPDKESIKAYKEANKNK